MADSGKVYKDQCAFCFNSAEMEGGLFICVAHKFAYCTRHVKIHNEVDKCKKFVRFIRLRRRLDKPAGQGEQEQPPESKITKLAIGLEGGCLIEPKFEFCDSWTVIDNYPIVDDKSVDPGDVQVQDIIKAESAYRLRELEALAGTWDGSALIETKHKNLTQLPFTGKIPPKGWRCQFEGGCEKTENLWMNLTDGKILCGRKNFDGSGGNNHALEHFYKTKYPLAVNLGTITPQTADVYSYDEDEMVLNQNLSNHLKHFGINMMEMEKTEKTMIEKELDLNKTWEYASIQEDGHKLEPVFGPGFTGIHNLGNSCYMNSLLQSFVQMPDIVEPIAGKADEIFSRCRKNPYDDLWVQTAKMFVGLMSGDYSFSAENASHKEGFEPPENGVRPYDFRHIIGKNHVEFSTKKQQDVEEYMRYLSEKFRTCLNEMNLSVDTDPLLPTNYLAHVVEDNGKTVYFTSDCIYDVDFDVKPRPKSSSTNVENVDRPTVNLIRRLKEMMERPDTVKSGRIVRFATFPRYLLIKVNRHSITDDWQPVKLDYNLEVDDVLDLEFMRGPSPQPTDKIMIEKNQPGAAVKPPSPKPAAVMVKQENLSMLSSMGFSENACMKALAACHNDITAALDWIMARAGDPSLDLPPEPQAYAGARERGPSSVDAQSLNILLESGFSEAKAREALRKCNNNIEAAFGYLLDGDGTDADDTDVMEHADSPMRPTTPSADQSIGLLEKLKRIDGRGCFKLTGVISHIGSSTRTGHYVYHGGNRWAIFNDEKVAWSESPPLAFGYVYIYKRTDV